MNTAIAAEELVRPVMSISLFSAAIKVLRVIALDLDCKSRWPLVITQNPSLVGNQSRQCPMSLRAGMKAFPSHAPTCSLT